MGDVLAIAEQRDGKIRPVANEVVTVAASVAEGLGGSAHALVLGGAGVGEHAGDLGNFGAEVVRVGEDPALEGHVPETHAAVIAEVVASHGYAAVLFAATARIHVAFVPELEDEKRPKLLAVVVRALGVLREKLLHVVRIQETFALQLGRRELILDELLQVSVEPIGDRHVEALLLTRENFVWKNAFHGFLEDEFR